MTGRGSSPIGTQPLRTGKPWRVKRGFGGQTENIAGGLFAMYRCAMKPESSSDGMEPLSTSKIASGLSKPFGKEIGRASCRERVWIRVVAWAMKEKTVM